jgi:hypothetical protein
VAGRVWADPYANLIGRRNAAGEIGYIRLPHHQVLGDGFLIVASEHEPLPLLAVYEAGSPLALTKTPTDNQVRAVSGSPSGSRFLTIDVKGIAQVWTLEENTRPVSVFRAGVGSGALRRIVG